MSESSGIKKFFERNWEKMVLWAILIGLFYIMKSFLLLVFLTFLITYISMGIVQLLVGKFTLNYKFATIAVFLVFISLLAVVVSWTGPRLASESSKVLQELAGEKEDQSSEKLGKFLENIVIKIVGDEKGHDLIISDEYSTFVKTIKNETSKALKSSFTGIIQSIFHVVKLGWEMIISLFLAIIFSFILVIDWLKIKGKIKELENSRIRTFYVGAAPHLVAFGNILGKALRAQAIIATFNTIFTAAGLYFFNMPNIFLLSAVVFICGFIPILGTFLSSIPIILFGAQFGGLTLVIKLILFVSIIHAFEAYVLNPRITAEVLRVHPILILILLLIGERFFGVWGMIIGVPLGFYVISILTDKEEIISHEKTEC